MAWKRYIGPFCQTCGRERGEGEAGYHPPKEDDKYTAWVQIHPEICDFRHIQWWCWSCHVKLHENLLNPKQPMVSSYLLQEVKQQLAKAVAQNESLRKALKQVHDMAKASEEIR